MDGDARVLRDPSTSSQTELEQPELEPTPLRKLTWRLYDIPEFWDKCRVLCEAFWVEHFGLAVLKKAFDNMTEQPTTPRILNLPM